MAEVVLSKFYVDDCLTGANTEEAAIQLRSELNQLLSKGQFRLRKWRSNSSKVLESIPEELKETEVIQSLPEENHKALGIHLGTNQDTSHIATPDLGQQDRPCTKRSVSSDVAKVYDIPSSSTCIRMDSVERRIVIIDGFRYQSVLSTQGEGHSRHGIAWIC